MVSQTESNHPSDAQLLATIHAESVVDLAAIHAHADGCAQCAARRRTLMDDDAMIGRLLAELDAPPRTADQPRFTLVSHRSWLHRGLRIAGAAATLAVAAAALVVPASPVHRVLFPAVNAPRLNPGTTANQTAAAVASGIAVPASRSLVIVFRQEQSHGAIEITRTATGDVAFRSRGGNTAYQVAAGRVSIDNAAPADEYQVDLPGSVQQLRIVVGTRVLLQWPEDSARYATAARPGHVHVPLDIGGTHAQ